MGRTVSFTVLHSKEQVYPAVFHFRVRILNWDNMRNPASLISLLYFVVIYDIATALQCPDGRQVECDRYCILVYQPVCGSDFQTYPNSCVLYTVRDCCGAFLYILYGGPCMFSPIMPFPQFYPPAAIPSVVIANNVNPTVNQGQQTPHVNPASQVQQTPNVNPGSQFQQTANVIPGIQGQQVPNGIPGSVGTISHGSAAANSGANSTATGNDLNSLQHSWTSTVVNAGSNAQVNPQQANLLSR